ncbi:PTS fructose transporter subunit IIC [Sporohalobacter salinus]|uniref:PTS fructose transporter subunit IIC n=1 Tax=Sporohalobacter salinus TaxID=1494606 RepID=UPI0019618F8F|nr:fructose-specific PTS transporter subunit EIIC [Sporohalobacter salinus]MBM7624171.1 PTS system fructose-specific IIC component [Sporohalobacter salinus]
MKKIIAVTSCPTGIAHTFMAAEALEEAAKEKGLEVKVETRAAEGTENELTVEDIQEAEAVIVAADTDVDTDRFQGKPVVSTVVADAINNAAGLIEEALTKAENFESCQEDFVSNVQNNKKQRSSQRKGLYKHLMNGVSRMIPFVVAGGLMIALSFAVGGIHTKGRLASALMQIGGDSAFALMVPILAGYIAISIADRPGLAPGMIGGMLASKIGAGFLGGIIAGFLAGYITKWLKDNIKLPEVLKGLKPVLILPLLSTLIVGLLMVFVVGNPVKIIMDSLQSWLEGMTGTNRVILGIILGAMMAFDTGGPVNKAAYTFATGLLASKAAAGPTIMAAVMAGGMTPPLGLALATFVAGNKFSTDQKEAGKAAGVLGISFITEGAIPFAAADPIRVIPSIAVGSAVAGALSMLFRVTLQAPHGGIFVLAIPGAVGNLGMYIISILAGTIVTAALISILKSEVD